MTDHHNNQLLGRASSTSKFLPGTTTHYRTEERLPIGTPTVGHITDFEGDLNPSAEHLSRVATLPAHKSDTSPPTPAQSRRTANFDIYRVAGIPKSSSVPTFHAVVSNLGGRQNSSDLPVNVPLKRTQSNPTSTTARSPAHRKPPASHSSYGIDSSCGPPPSYSTQRTLSQDRLWTSDNKRYKTINEREQPTRDEHISAAPASERTPDNTTDEVSKSGTVETRGTIISTTDVNMDTSSYMSEYGLHVHEKDTDHNRTLRQFRSSGTEEESKISSSDERKSEDLFLNIAKKDAVRQDPTGRTDKRKSRISLPFFTSARSNVGQKTQSSPVQTGYDSVLLSPRTGSVKYHRKRSSLGHYTTASARPVEDPQRPRTQGNISRATSTVARSVTSRAGYDNGIESSRGHISRLSDANTEVGLAGLATSSHGHRFASDSNMVGRPRYTDHNATESTVSTNAPSTLWDELDDLKSRIHKLELTGKLPASSAAAMSSADRPWTATTAATTLSSSPKNGKPVTTMQSAIEGIPTTVHPLLHEALSQAKPVLSNDVFQRLQATASDALQIVAMLTGDVQNGASSMIDISSPTERQIRRRAESMCRGITELTITLSLESKFPVSPHQRPASRDASTNFSSGFASRRFSNEAANLPPFADRVQSRLDSRRMSVMSVQPTSVRTSYSSPETAVQNRTPQPPSQTMSTSGLQRTSTLTRHRRAQGYLDGTADEDDSSSSPGIRPVSRAMTDVGSGYRRSPRDRSSLSREYTSQHPMPTQYERSGFQQPHMPAGSRAGANLQSRRKFSSPASVMGGQDSSPLNKMEVFGRIAVMGPSTSSVDSTPEDVTVTRSVGPRRIGLAHRISSSVGSRLRAVRAERNGIGKGEQKEQAEKEMVSSSQDEESMNAPEEANDRLSANDE